MNKLHAYMGGGKGKTTAAMGLAVRNLGHGNRVLIGQFMKDGCSGELRALAQLPGAEICVCEPVHGFVFQQTPEQQLEIARMQTAYVHRLIERIQESSPQMVILDELGIALHLGMVNRSEAERLIDTALASGETVVTGMSMPEWLLARADYVSRIEAQRHPYETEKLEARKGVEW